MEKAVKEIRLVDMRALDEEGMTVEGYAAVFNTVTDLGWMHEVIDRHAFDNADMSDIVMKYNHEDSVLPMARTRGGSLQFNIDNDRDRLFPASFFFFVNEFIPIFNDFK